MTTAKRPFIAFGFLLLLAAPALAGDGNGGAVLFAFSVVPAGILILALPFAVVIRATCTFPLKVTEGFSDQGHLKRLVGIGGLVLGLVAVNLLGRIPYLNVVAVILLLAIGFLILAGLSAASCHLGRRLFRERSRGEGVGGFVLGWLLLAGTALFPVLGPLYLLYNAVWGAGAVLLGLFAGRGDRREKPLAA